MIRSTFLKTMLAAVCFSISILHANAQQSTVSGIVMNSESGEPVEFATLQLLSGSGNTFAGYGMTDANGAFNIKGNRTDSLRIVVSLIGYKTHQQPVRDGDVLRISLEEEAFELDEVMVRPGRVWATRDTVNYNLADFMSATDNTLKDVLQRLPGIMVDESGKISYQGRDISNLYIEGMDPVGGRYNQITNNLRPQAVETVQVMDNHQPIKMLEDLVASEDVAINLRLKAEYQAVWMINVEGGIGASPLLWYTSDNAIRLSRTNQAIYSYKGNNVGIDYTLEQGILGGMRMGNLFGNPSSISFLNQPSIMAPLRTNRLLFNDVHAFTANQMYRLNETTKMRLNANYSTDVRTQNRGSETVFYWGEDTVHVAEQSRTQLFSNEAALGMHIENNAANKYLTNSLNLAGKWNKALSDFWGTETTNFQEMNTGNLSANNDFRMLWGNADYKYELKSLLRYEHQPESLRTDHVQQNTLLNRFYGDNSFSITGSRGYWVPQLAMGVNTDINNLQTAVNPYFAPGFQWNKDKWQTRFSMPLIYSNYLDTDFSRFSVRPSANLSYRYNFAWRFTASASYREQYGDLLNFFGNPYYTNHQNMVKPADNLPIQQMQNYSLGAEFRRTAAEFFASLSLGYGSTANTHIYEQTVENGVITLTPHERNNQSTTSRISGTISKGFFDIGLQTSLTAQAQQTTGERLNNGEILSFTSNRFGLEPKIDFTYIRNIELKYQAHFNLVGSKVGDRALNPLWNVLQKMQLTYVLPKFEATFETDHYFNQLNETNVLNNVFLDLTFRYKFEKWRLSLEMNNLLNKKQYAYAEYSDDRSFNSWINIRGREFLIGAQYRF